MPSHPRIHPIYICIYVVIVHLPLPVLLVIFSPLRYSCAASCVENKQSDRPDIRRMTEKKIAGLSKFFDGYAAEDHRPDCGFSLPSRLQPPFPLSKQLPLIPSFRVTIRYVAWYIQVCMQSIAPLFWWICKDKWQFPIIHQYHDLINTVCIHI